MRSSNNIIRGPVVRRISLAILGNSAALALAIRRRRVRSELTILNFHSVSDDRVSGYKSLRPKLFDELVGWLKRHFVITTFADLPTAIDVTRPYVIISFDDGYLDFQDVVMPILVKHGIKVNLNIVPYCIESGAPPMNVVIQDFIAQAPEKLLREINFPPYTSGIHLESRSEYSLAVSNAFKSNPIAVQKKIFSDLNEQFARFDSFKPSAMLRGSDLAEIARLHEVGCHSFEHATMSFESNEYVADDVIKCRDWYQEKFCSAPSIYAFPNGLARKEQLDVVLEAGFSDVLLVGERTSTVGASVHPRMTIYGENSSELRVRAAGMLNMLRRGV